MSDNITLMNPPKDATQRQVIETRLKQAFAQFDQAVATVKPAGAQAFTTGNQIFLAAGAYSPDSAAGRQLLAHELTHVVQQGASR